MNTELLICFEHLIQNMTKFESMNFIFLKHHDEFKIRGYLWIKVIEELMFNDLDNAVKHLAFLRFNHIITKKFLKEYSELYLGILKSRDILLNNMPTPEMEYCFETLKDQDELITFCDKIQKDEIWI